MKKRLSGVVRWWDGEVGVGSIDGDDGEQYLARYDDIRGIKTPTVRNGKIYLIPNNNVVLYAGMKVEFDPHLDTMTNKQRAKSIEIIA